MIHTGKVCPITQTLCSLRDSSLGDRLSFGCVSVLRLSSLLCLERLRSVHINASRWCSDWWFDFLTQAFVNGAPPPLRRCVLATLPESVIECQPTIVRTRCCSMALTFLSHDNLTCLTCRGNMTCSKDVHVSQHLPEPNTRF